MNKNHRLTTKDRIYRHIFVGTGERCEVCGFKKAYFLHNAPNSGKDWAKAEEK